MRVLMLAAMVTVLVGCSAERPAPQTSDINTKGGQGPLSACPADFKTDKPKAGWNKGFEIDGEDRSFWLIPPQGDFKGPRPLFVGLHGTTEDGKDFATRANLVDFARRGFWVVSPSGEGHGTVWPVWDAMRRPEDKGPNPDMAYLDVLVGCLEAHFEIDPARRYIGGHSAGGIMTNAVLQRRSDIYAGGIVASGVFSLTSPSNAKAMAPTFALVTWGGHKDNWRGSASSSVRVPSFNFVEQASLASTHYSKQETVSHARCSMPIGHAWLSDLNDWMIDRLLAHPGGVATGADAWAPPPKGSGATCAREPFEYKTTVEVTCEAGKIDGCDSVCQFFGDCAVENGTIGAVLGGQLRMLGFQGAQCGGCVSKCDKVATSDADKAVLACMDKARSSAVCGPGIEGAYPLIEAVNGCCKAHPGAGLCQHVCKALRTNTAAMRFFPVCAE